MLQVINMTLIYTYLIDESNIILLLQQKKEKIQCNKKERHVDR